MRQFYTGIFGGEVENNFETLPAGNYKGKIIDVVCKTSSNSGKDYIQITYELENNRKVWDILSWANEKALGVMKGKLEALGFTQDERHQLPEEGGMLQVAVYEKVQGNLYNVNIGIRPAEGDYAEKNTVKSVKRVEASEMNL